MRRGYHSNGPTGLRGECLSISLTFLAKGGRGGGPQKTLGPRRFTPRRPFRVNGRWFLERETQVSDKWFNERLEFAA